MLMSGLHMVTSAAGNIMVDFRLKMFRILEVGKIDQLLWFSEWTNQLLSKTGQK